MIFAFVRQQMYPDSPSAPDILYANHLIFLVVLHLLFDLCWVLTFNKRLSSELYIVGGVVITVVGLVQQHAQ